MATNMNEGFLRALSKVRELVADFQESEVAFLAMGYSEQAARKDFRVTKACRIDSGIVHHAGGKNDLLPT